MRHKQRNKQSFQLSHAYKAPGECQDECCSDDSGKPTGGLAAWPTLHELLHPGCAHKGFNPKNGATPAKMDHSYSLNTSSAMLHLMSDVLRGFLIFTVALLMKCHAVSSASRADAICALLVSALVVLGSGPLLLEVARALCIGGSAQENDGM